MQLFGLPLSLARSVWDQRQRERSKKVFSLQRHELESIGKPRLDFVAPERAGDRAWLQTELVHHIGGMILQAMVHADSDVCMRVDGMYRIQLGSPRAE